MPSTEKNRLLMAIRPMLKAHGFKKTGASWHRMRDNVVQTLNVQGSQWARAFYVNLGVYFRALGNRVSPPEYECHVRSRLDNLLNDPHHCDSILDFDNDMLPEERFRGVVELIESYAIPWLEEFSDPGRIAAVIAGPENHGFLVMPDVFELVGVERQRRPRT